MGEFQEGGSAAGVGVSRYVSRTQRSKVPKLHILFGNQGLVLWEEGCKQLEVQCNGGGGVIYLYQVRVSVAATFQSTSCFLLLISFMELSRVSILVAQCTFK